MLKYYLLKQHTELVETQQNMYSQQRYWWANYLIHLLILDMLKTFDAINRSMLMQELAKVLDPNKLHIIKVLTNPQPKIWCGNEKSDAFETDTGVPQGDCVWANLFTFYLAKVLDSNKHDDHDYCSTIIKPPAHITNNHQYAYINDKINLKIADNMGHVLPDMRNIEYPKKTLPLKLSSCDLIMNEEKTRIHY